jgi:hypothetical protein
MPEKSADRVMRLVWLKIDGACVTAPNAMLTRGNMPSVPVQGPVPSQDVFFGGEWAIDMVSRPGWVLVTHRDGNGRMVAFPRERVREVMWEEVDDG